MVRNHATGNETNDGKLEIGKEPDSQLSLGENRFETEKTGKKVKEASGGVEPPYNGFAIRCLSHLATTPLLLLVLICWHSVVKAESLASSPRVRLVSNTQSSPLDIFRQFLARVK